MKNMLKGMVGLVLLLFVVTAFAVTSSDKAKEASFKANITCDACKDKIESGFSSVSGVEKTEVDVASKTVKFAYNESKTNPDALAAKLKDLGYTAENVDCSSKEAKTSASATKAGCGSADAKPAGCSDTKAAKKACGNN
jgi:copper chaperone CopZ